MNLIHEDQKKMNEFLFSGNIDVIDLFVYQRGYENEMGDRDFCKTYLCLPARLMSYISIVSFIYL